MLCSLSFILTICSVYCRTNNVSDPFSENRRNPIDSEIIGQLHITSSHGFACSWSLQKNITSLRYVIHEEIYSPESCAINLPNTSKSLAPTTHSISFNNYPIETDLSPENAFIYNEGKLVFLLGKYSSDPAKSTANLLSILERRTSADKTSYQKVCSTIGRLGPLNVSWLLYHPSLEHIFAIRETFPFSQIVVFSSIDCTLVSYFTLPSRTIGPPIFDLYTNTLYMLVKNPSSHQSHSLICVTPKDSKISVDVSWHIEKVIPIPKTFSLDPSLSCFAPHSESRPGSAFKLFCPLSSGDTLEIVPKAKKFVLVPNN